MISMETYLAPHTTLNVSIFKMRGWELVRLCFTRFVSFKGRESSKGLFANNFRIYLLVIVFPHY